MWLDRKKQKLKGNQLKSWRNNYSNSWGAQ